MNLRTMLAPDSIAVIGASADPKRMSGMIVSQIRDFGFTGRVVPINPKYDTLAGFPCRASIRDLADNPPDVAVVFVNAQAALQVAQDCAEIGVGSLIMLTAGFAETGAEGEALQRRLVGICREAGMPMCGPNTAGLANFNSGFVAFGASGFLGLSHGGRGNVAVISSSGGLATTILGHCRQRGVAVSHLIGIGNEAHTTAADYLDQLLDDPDVACVLCLLESIRDAETFFAAAEKAADLGKQVVVMKQGRSEVGVRAIQTHTAALGGAVVDFEAACRARGIITVRELVGLADQALLATRLPAVSRYDLGVLSLPGGGTSLLADAAGEHGFALPDVSPPVAEALCPTLPPIATVANPLDPTAGFGRDRARLQASIETFAADPAFDLFFFFQSQAEPKYCRTIAEVLVDSAGRADKPFLVVWEAGEGLEDGAWRVLREAGIPLFPRTRDAFAALARHRDRAAWLHRRRELASEGFGALAGRDPALQPRSEFASVDAWLRALLETAAVPLPRADVVATEDEAVRSAEDIGFPVAVKLVSNSITHKTDVGGVHLNLADAAAVRAAARAIRAAVPAEDIDGLLVQGMIAAGSEWLVGIHTDEQVGPMVTVGFGGVLTDVVQDVTRRPVPVTRGQVLEMIGELRSGPLFFGYRGAARGAVEDFVEIVQSVAWIAHKLRVSRPEFELNPVILPANGGPPVAVDWAGIEHGSPPVAAAAARPAPPSDRRAAGS